jgi:hypothetical protein
VLADKASTTAQPARDRSLAPMRLLVLKPLDLLPAANLVDVQ